MRDTSSAAPRTRPPSRRGPGPAMAFILVFALLLGWVSPLVAAFDIPPAAGIPPAPAAPPPHSFLSVDALEPAALLTLDGWRQVTPADWPRLTLYYLADGQADLALALAQRLLEEDPDAPLYRWLRLEALALMDPWGFVAAVAGPAPAPAPEGDRARFTRDAEPLDLGPLPPGPPGDFEAALRAYLRTRIERARYRGDGVEAPQDFIARMEAQAAEASAALAPSAPTSPLGDLLRYEVQRWLGAADASPLEADADAWLSAALAADPHGVVPFFFGALLERDASLPAAGYALLRLETGDPLALSLALSSAEERARSLPWEAQVALYRALDARAAFPYDDDIALALARTLLSRRGNQALARARLEEALSLGYRNASPKAVRALAALDQQAGDLDAQLAVYRRYNASLGAGPRPAPWGKPILRQMGRALYDAGRHQEALLALNTLIEGPWGESRDYLYLADATHHVTSQEDALTLLDFATAVREREVVVEAWRQGWPPQLQAMKFRLFELGARLRHARIYPRTFVALAGGLLLDAILLGVCVVVFAGLPRLSRVAWRLGLVTGGLALLVQGAAVITGVPQPMGWVGEGAWVLIGVGRAFLLGAGAATLASHVGLPGMGVIRGARRALARGDVAGVGRRGLGVALGAGLLVGLSLALDGGGEGSAYLERLPGVLAAGSLGGDGGPGGIFLRLSRVLWGDLVAWGVLLGLAGVGVARLGARSLVAWGAAVVGVSVLWGGLMAGGGQDVPLRAAFLVGQGLILGTISVRQGLDGAILSHILAEILLDGGGME